MYQPQGAGNPVLGLRTEQHECVDWGRALPPCGYVHHCYQNQREQERFVLYDHDRGSTHTAGAFLACIFLAQLTAHR